MSREHPVSSPVAMAVAFLVLVAGVLVGFRLLTAEAETITASPTCEERTIPAGEAITPNLVKVDVYNASRRAGLANRLSINLQRRNFLPGEVGNSTSSVVPGTIIILSDDPQDPRVRLLQAHFRQSRVVPPDVPVSDDAITVLVGDDFGSLGADVRTVENDRDLTVCIPTVTTPQEPTDDEEPAAQG